VVFAGAGEFAVPALKALVRMDLELLLVISRPDRPKGRGRRPASTPVAETARKLGGPLRKTDRIAALDEELERLAPDLMIVADFGELIPEKTLSIPRLGAYNIHASLLPRWRGASPCAWAIKAGDTETGVTIFRMVKELDAGPVLCRKRVPIFPGDTAGFLEERLACEGAVLLERAVRLLASGEFTLEPQDPARATKAPKLSKRAGMIPWEEKAEAVERHIRAMQPWPRAWSFLKRDAGSPLRINIMKARVEKLPPEDRSPAPGTVTAITKSTVEVACGEGKLQLLHLQPAGKKAMSCEDFLRGYRVQPGDRFETEEEDMRPRSR